MPLSRWVWILAAAGTLLHFLFNRQYGFFRDELYYAACGEHPAWGYVDHSPLAPLISYVARETLGDSLFALRFFPALASAAKIFLGGWIAREIGGGKFAQGFAAFTVLCAPIYLTFDNFLSMNSFEPVFWMLCAAIVLHILNGGDARFWLLFGVVGGIGVLNKHSMLFFGSGLALGLLLTPARKVFRSPWTWCGAAVVFLIFLPNLLWEVRNHFPTIALLHTVIGTKYSTVSPLEFIAQQTLLTHPLAAPVWLLGLWFFLHDTKGRKYAFLAWAYFVVLAEMILLHGKIYYLAPAYIMLLAGGAVWIEKRAVSRTGFWLKPALIVPLLLGAAVAAPLAMPVLSVRQAIRYSAFWDVKAVHVENVPQGDLPQLFGDMFGWEDQVQAMSRAYASLPEEGRQRAALLAYNYGEAGAIDYFGKRYGLPKAISGHNQYGYWGPRGYTGEIVVAIGFPLERLQRSFDDVRPFETISPTYAMPEETNLTIFICRKPRQPLSASWTEWMYLD
ncbi:MAG TPA: glycosyltransferase family 39 protein [Candidatus Dormibacteraeota bacterium]|nr:glycosyltransferase family 39 protein [Candidatus Dormibacteraeota bacterium]